MKNILLIIIAVLFLAVAGFRHDVLVGMRSDYRIDSASYLENAPPLVVFTTVALGGFRGLIADILWLRISHLQQRGSFFELVQLADWVTGLDPRNTEAWSFHAWNMVYNISIMMVQPEDKWRWVMNGVKLLRDEGLLYNPGDPDLYRETGWLFQHKIGGDMDFAEQYYKDRWAEMMDSLFDWGRPDYEHLSVDIRRRMIEEYKLIPEIMLEVEHQFGPLDWRKPHTHSLYWAYRGLKLCKEGKDTFLFEAMIRQSLDALHGSADKSGL